MTTDEGPMSETTGSDSDEIILAPEHELAVPRTDMTVPEMRAWLRNWVATSTGQAPDAISESVPMVELGLSSRDAVAMATVKARSHTTTSAARPRMMIALRAPTGIG